jgi:cell fate (sporulation/competence/biofilm development) regulator YlbF (YheA/YmcA/DUF963 family)
MEEDEAASDDPADHYGSVKTDKCRGGTRMTEHDVMEAAKKLAGIIRETDVYGEYLHQREELKKQPQLYDQVNEYRQKNFDIQNGMDGAELFDKMEAFEREYREFRENPVVDDFLRAELAFCRMMQEMYVLLTAEIDFE